jgi:hypothetical protein
MKTALSYMSSNVNAQTSTNAQKVQLTVFASIVLIVPIVYHQQVRSLVISQMDIPVRYTVKLFN